MASVNKRATMTQKDTEGPTAARLISAFNTMSGDRQTELLKPTPFKKWVKSVFQSTLDNPARILTVLRHRRLRQLFHRFCSTRYGEETFSWTTANNIVASRLDCIWIPMLEELFTSVDTIFPKKERDPSFNDWKLISKVKSEAQLRLLFFPRKADYWDCDDKPTGNAWPLGDGWKKIDLPQLNVPAVTEHDRFTNRRPNFLRRFNDDEYVAVFHRLRENPGLVLPTWDNWVKAERDVSNTVRAILPHIIKWVKPAWYLPAVGSNEYKVLAWDKTFVELVLKNDLQTTPGPRRPWGNANPSYSAFLEKAQTFLHALWEQVENNVWWNGKFMVADMLKDPPLSFASVDWEDDDEVQEYLERFKRMAWINVVNLVLTHAGPCFTHSMKQFNDKQYLSRQLGHGLTFGSISANANYKHNGTLSAIPALNNPKSRSKLSAEMDMAGAKWMYIETKSLMLDTLKFGMKAGKSKDESKHHVLKTRGEYQSAKETLRTMSVFLDARMNDFATDMDNWNENLTRYTSSPEVDERPRCAGFLAAKPKNFPKEALQNGMSIPKRPRDDQQDGKSSASAKKQRTGEDYINTASGNGSSYSGFDDDFQSKPDEELEEY